MTRRQLILLAVPLTLLVGGYGLKTFLASKRKDPDKKPMVNAVRYVPVKPIRYTSTRITLKGYGRLQSEQAITLLAEVSGKLMAGEVPMRRSVSFSKGQLLYQIDDREARLALQAQRADYMTLVANVLPDLKLDFPTDAAPWEAFLSRILPTKNLPELPELNSKPSTGLLTARRVIAQYYQIRSAEERLAKYRFYAPFSGTFTLVNQESGSIVNANTNLGRIIKTEAYELSMPMPRSEAALLKSGMTVQLRSSDGSIQVSGRLNRISSFLDAATQSLTVFITVSRSDSKVYDGMYLEGTIDTGKSAPLMALPRKAMLQDQNVYIVKDSLLTMSPVNVLKSDEAYVYFNGPEEGALLVTENLVGAMPNMKVNPAIAK
jgi:membrane fusion protein (multidrug efflux system)